MKSILSDRRMDFMMLILSIFNKLSEVHTLPKFKTFGKSQ